MSQREVPSQAQHAGTSREVEASVVDAGASGSCPDSLYGRWEDAPRTEIGFGALELNRYTNEYSTYLHGRVEEFGKFECREHDVILLGYLGRDQTIHSVDVKEDAMRAVFDGHRLTMRRSH